MRHRMAHLLLEEISAAFEGVAEQVKRRRREDARISWAAPDVVRRRDEERKVWCDLEHAEMMIKTMPDGFVLGNLHNAREIIRSAERFAKDGRVS